MKIQSTYFSVARLQALHQRLYFDLIKEKETGLVSGYFRISGRLAQSVKRLAQTTKKTSGFFSKFASEINRNRIMEWPLKTLVLFAAILLTGLSAGFFYAWQVSVILGMKKVADVVYAEAMQSINREILNPAFFVVFFGPMIALGTSTVQQYQNGAVFWLLLAATLTYTAGAFAVTGLGNVPLNNELDALKLGEMTALQVQDFREYYEVKWNRFHLIRTVFAVLSFSLSLTAVFVSGKC